MEPVEQMQGAVERRVYFQYHPGICVVIYDNPLIPLGLHFRLESADEAWRQGALHLIGLISQQLQTQAGYLHVLEYSMQSCILVEQFENHSDQKLHYALRAYSNGMVVLYITRRALH